MSDKKYSVKAECPSCGCGSINHLSPETLSDKFIGNEKEIDVLCPLCGTKHKGEMKEGEG